MKITFLRYSGLMDILSAVSTVTEDANLEENRKNIIFQIDTVNETLKFIGVNKNITYKRAVSEDLVKIELKEDEVNKDNPITYLQIKSKELCSFLNTYKSLRKTQVEEVSFETLNATRISCSILETDKETGTPHISKRNFVNVPIMQNMLGFITLSASDAEVKPLSKASLQLYIQTLGPNLQTGTDAFSYIMFGADYNVVMSTGYYSYMTNQLAEGGIFTGIRLGYKVVNLIDKVICIGDPEGAIGVAKLSSHIYLKTDDAEAFVVYDSRLADYSMGVNAFKKDYAISLDRVYFKDVLKRLSYENESITIVIDSTDGSIKLSNNSFSQEISALRTKNLEELGNLAFKITPEVINKMILGNDDICEDELFIYLNKVSDSKVAVIFTDAYGGWFTYSGLSLTKAL